jgi:hypothetical protein
LFTVQFTVFRVSITVWVLAVAQVFIPELVAAEVAAVVGSDVAVAVGGSECRTGGWRRGWSAVGRLGSVCRCFRGAGGCFEAEDRVIVVVVDIVANVDGGCAAVVSDAVADSGDGWGLETVGLGVLSVELGGFVDVPTFFSKRGSSSYVAVCISVSTVAVRVSVDVPVFLSKRGSPS